MHPIRKAQARDIPRLLDLLLQVNEIHHQGRPDLFKGPATKYSRQDLLQIIQNDQTPVFVYADQDTDTVLGYVFCLFKQEIASPLMTDIKTLYIDDLCVDEQARGRRIGRALYEYAVSFAREKGCYNLTLNVWALNDRALRFYRQCGLTPQKIGMEKIL